LPKSARRSRSSLREIDHGDLYLVATAERARVLRRRGRVRPGEASDLVPGRDEFGNNV
jgi:hypothetical protein